MRNDGYDQMAAPIFEPAIQEELAKANWIQDMIKHSLMRFNKMVRVDDPDVHKDEDGNDVDALEFVSEEFDDTIVRGRKSGKFYFHDETYANIIGPYDTEDEAREQEHQYYAEVVSAQDEV